MPPTKNAKGQIYPWAIEGKNFGMFESVFKFQCFISSFADEVGKRDEVTNNFSEAEFPTYDNDGIHDECANGLYFGGTTPSELVGKIKVNGRHQGYQSYFTPEQEPKALECYEKTMKVADEVCEKLRNQYAGRTDEKSLHMQEKANELADWIEQQSKLYDPKGGNIMEAEFHAPYLFILNVVSGGAPKFDSAGLEKCVEVMEQKGIPGGKNIYDDYMTLMNSGARETALQFDRQKMEETGWDAQKEAEYLKRLHYEHQKSIDAFDRLWEIDDHGQYDEVLNNPLDELLSKRPDSGRDMNDAIGYMRGENRAIELGYDSTHLLALAQIGMQEQTLKKMGFQLEKRLAAEEDPEKKKALEEQKAKLQDYKKDLDEFKKDVWNKKVNSKEEMEATGKKVDDFFAAHQEKYADIQNVQKRFETSVEYVKETAQNAPEIKRPQEKITRKDIDPIGAAAVNAAIDGFDPMASSKYTDIANAFRSDEKGNLDQKSVGKVKAFAAELSEIHEKKIQELEKEETKFPNAQAYHKVSLLGVKRKLDNFAQGIASRPGIEDRSFNVFMGLKIQESNDLFEPQNLEKTDKAVEQLGLVEYGQKALKLQEMHQNFELNKDIMSPADRRKAYAQIIDAKKDFLKASEELDQKLANPSEEVKYMFVKQVQIDDIRGERALKGLFKQFSKDIMKVDVPQADQTAAALTKFNTSRAAVFKSESDEHKEMREAAEQVQKDMERLQNGTVKDSQTGEVRAMTQEERKKALQEAWKHAKTLNEKTDKYIAHATKNGTKTPHTDAGKDRLEGAREMKALTTQYMEQLGAQPDLQTFATKERINDLREAKYGKGGAKALASMDKEVEKLRDMSKQKEHGSTIESQSLGLNEFELQVAKVVAIAGVKEGLEKGQIEPLDLKAEVLAGTKKVARDADFQKWVKTISNNPEKMKEFATKYSEDVKKDFVNSLSKDLEKKAEHKKEGPKVEGKKTDKKHEDPQIKDPVMN